MNDKRDRTITPAYRLKVEPINGLIVARRGDEILARSEHGKLMRETRLPPVAYFPRKDVFCLSGSSQKRTFCPFKGTAAYEDLAVGDEIIKNGAWHYPRALRESKSVENMIAFMPGVAQIDLPADIELETHDGHITGPLIDWLLREAGGVSEPAALTAEIARKFRESGIAVSRLNVSIWPRHPEIAGYSFIWSKEDDQVRIAKARHEMLRDQAYVNSPIRFVSEGLGGVRQPLKSGETEFNFPIMAELIERGATDYVAMPLTFTDGRVNVLTLATDHPDGFTTANLGLIFEMSGVIAKYYEVETLRLDAQAILDTYLGKRTGARVLGGEIKRGDGDDIEAALLYCDLRNSSRLSNDMSKEDYLTLLNRYFEEVSQATHACGGEILKFVGDAVLAVFPVDGQPQAASQNAIDASCEITDRLATVRNTEKCQLECAIGVAFGSVTYGNVGAAGRLDFTVTGPAANLAARLSEHCKVIGVPILIGPDLAAMAGRGLRSAGTFTPRNFDRLIEVFVPESASKIGAVH